MSSFRLGCGTWWSSKLDLFLFQPTSSTNSKSWIAQMQFQKLRWIQGGVYALPARAGHSLYSCLQCSLSGFQCKDVALTRTLPLGSPSLQSWQNLCSYSQPFSFFRNWVKNGPNWKAYLSRFPLFRLFISPCHLYIYYICLVLYMCVFFSHFFSYFQWEAFWESPLPVSKPSSPA